MAIALVLPLCAYVDIGVIRVVKAIELFGRIQLLGEIHTELLKVRSLRGQ